MPVRNDSHIRLFTRLLPGVVLVIAMLFASPFSGAARHNILLIIADDFATDGLRIYNTNPAASLPPMPTIERLAQSGLTFRNAYSYPTCSPTRSTILTGRHGYRTGIGYALATPQGPSLSTNEFTLAEALSAGAPQVRHGMVGKWHLSFNASDPNTIGGFSHFSGGLLGELQAYDQWPRKVTNGVTLGSAQIPYSNYATTDNLRDATNWISAQTTNSWFLWLAFNACHEPLHLPPAALHTYTNLSGSETDISTNARPYYEALAQSLDTTFSNLLAFLGPQTNETTIVFLGDNGTPPRNIQPPYTTNQCKGTLYEGGIRVPLIVSGPKVAGVNRSTDALVSTVDLYATLLELAGVNLATTLPTNLVFDSRSFLPVITNAVYQPPDRFVLSENFSSILADDLAGRAVRNGRFKLIQFNTGAQEMYDLVVDPYEHTNLLATTLSGVQQTNYVALMNQFGQWQYAPPPTVTGFGQNGNRFFVQATRPSGAPTWLWRNSTLDYPVWTVVTNVVTLPISATEVRLTDTNPPASGAFYRMSLRAVPPDAE